jgi:hypothetical protein
MWSALQDIGYLGPDLPGELNLNGIKWLNLHDKIIVLFFIKCMLYFRKKIFYEERRTCGGLQLNVGLVSPSRPVVLRLLTKGLFG